jgi:hypothetical protein
LHGLTSRKRQDASTSLQTAPYAALLLLLGTMAGCSSLAVTNEDTPASGPDRAYNGLVANRLKSFKNYASYDAFEISDFRWVRSINGWSWLTCVRFQERGQRRSYALFIKESRIIDSRYAIQADGCDTRAYSPFDQMVGATRPASAGVLEPLY